MRNVYCSSLANAASQKGFKYKEHYIINITYNFSLQNASRGGETMTFHVINPLHDCDDFLSAAHLSHFI